MDALTIFPPKSIGPGEPSDERPAADLHVVEPGRVEKADHRQQRRAFQDRCRTIAESLARTRRFEDRLELYRTGGFTYRELSTACALYPDLMPKLNDEWEWIALTLVDNLD